MLDNGFIRSGCDSKKSSVGLGIYLLLHVNYMLVASKSKSEVLMVKHLLKNEFEMKDMGSACKILGMEIKRNRDANALLISQADYIQKVLKKFNMHVAKPVMTPMAQHFKLSAKDSPETEEK